MNEISLAGLLAICALALSACFASEEPLIDKAASATPLKPGNYVAIDKKPGDKDPPTRLKVTTEGNATIFTNVEPGDDDEPTKVLMRKVRGNYYAMLESKEGEKSYIYMLAEIDGAGMKMYDFTDACKTLEGIAADKRADITSYGVARVEKGAELDTCYFKRFEDLATAFKAVMDARPLKLVTEVTPAA